MYPYPTFPESDFPERGVSSPIKNGFPLKGRGKPCRDRTVTPAVKDSPMVTNKNIGRKIVLLLPVEEQAQEAERSPKDDNGAGPIEKPVLQP